MRRALAALAVLIAVVPFVAGCGTKFDLPTETLSGRLLPSDNSYQMVSTWTGMVGIADILLTQGPGSQLFLLSNHPGIGPASRGAVYAFAIKARPPTPAPLPGIEFRSLFVPAALCAGNGKVFVLDEGDTALARDQVSGRISDLNTYWRVREFGLLGGDTLSSFTDTSFAFVRGIAADDQGRVYVSGTAIILVSDPQNASIRTRTFQYRISRYRPVAPGSVTPDPYMPGTDRWVRDLTYVIEEGSGRGTVVDPRGLHWARTGVPGGPALFLADRGKNWVQRRTDDQPSLNDFALDVADGTTLNGPDDVAADLTGFLYVADTGNGRVLRFDGEGNFVQRVDVELDSDGAQLQEPVAVAADDSLVYVADRAAGKVIRYQRRK